MDNRIFNVNGNTYELLELAIGLALKQCRCRAITAWSFHPVNGLVFYWYNSEGTNKFPVDITAKSAAEIAWEWLNTEEAKSVKCEGWDADADHDGHNSKGWRVFVQEWGHVGGSPYAICAVRPAYMWHGK